MSQHRTITQARAHMRHLGWCRDRFHLVPLLASASVPRRLSRAGTSFTLHYNNSAVLKTTLQISLSVTPHAQALAHTKQNGIFDGLGDFFAPFPSGRMCIGDTF
eukprot:g1581.t1